MTTKEEDEDIGGLGRGADLLKGFADRRSRDLLILQDRGNDLGKKLTSNVSMALAKLAASSAA